MEGFTKDDAVTLAMGIAKHAPNYPDKVKLGMAIFEHCPDLVTIILAQEDIRKSEAPKLTSPPPAIVNVPLINAVQMTLWDNWLDVAPEKKVGNQFGLTVEVYWDKPADIKLSKPNFKCSAALMLGKQLHDHVRKNFKDRAYANDPVFVETLKTYSKRLENKQHLGLVNTNIFTNDSEYQRGICYHDDQFVTMDGDLGSLDISNAQLHVAGQTLDFNHFSSKPYFDPKKSKNKANAGKFAQGIVGQARIDLCNFFPLWATNSLDDEE